MTKNRNSLLPDDLIRDALRRELDSIEAPPVEAAWQRLQARRAAGSDSVAEPAASAPGARTWTRYFSLAAAVLLVFVGGWSVYRSLNIDIFRGAHLMAPEAEESADVLTAGNDGAESALPFSLDGWDLAEFSREADRWPPSELDGYVLDVAYTRQAESGAPYLAFLYRRNGDSLLWVQSDAGSREQFTADLSGLLQTPSDDSPGKNGEYGFRPDSRSALIWEAEGRFFLLWDLTGNAGESDLRGLLP